MSAFAESAPTEARRRAARKMFAHQARMEEKAEKIQVRPEFRERVEELMRGEWNEPVIVLRLSDDGLGFEVPGRRRDGTIKGKKLVRRFFWNLLRAIGGVAVSIFSLANSGPPINTFYRQEIRVKGPASAMVLGLADQVRAANGPWLVCSPSSLALVDTGSTYLDPATVPPPRIVWQARGPQAPEINFRRRTITWPDGSTFRFPLHGRTEEQHLRKYHEFPDIIHWNGRPA